MARPRSRDRGMARARPGTERARVAPPAKPARATRRAPRTRVRGRAPCRAEGARSSIPRREGSPRSRAGCPPPVPSGTAPSTREAHAPSSAAEQRPRERRRSACGLESSREPWNRSLRLARTSAHQGAKAFRIVDGRRIEESHPMAESALRRKHRAFLLNLVRLARRSSQEGKWEESRRREGGIPRYHARP